MKICIDCRAASHPQRGGYKTYTENLLLGLSKIDETHEYLLLLDRDMRGSHLPRPPHSSVRIVGNELPIMGAPLREQLLLPRVLPAVGCDLVHFPCNTGPLWYNRRYVITVHDLNAVVAPTSFLDSYSLGHVWRHLITKYTGLIIPRLVVGAAAIITDSHATKEEILKVLGVPSEQVFVTHLAPGPAYHPLEEGELVGAKTELKRRYGIGKPYILAIGDRRSKNLAGILRAFTQLDSSVRSTHIVVTVVATRVYMEDLEREIRSLGLEEKVIVLSNPAPERLVQLYNCAEILAFPSFREGFGLPVVEAMACGTPVVTSTIPPLLETAGGAAILVDPHDNDAIAAAIERVLNNHSLRQELRRAGLKRASQLSWEKTAEQTVRVYEHALEIPIT